MLFEILTQHNLSELYDKKKRFEEQKDLDSDPLIRYCPKAGCGKYIKAKDENDVHLKCQHCDTEVCFKCRGEWHEGKTCDEAM